MRIRVSGSTSATKSLSSSVSVILSWSESTGVKYFPLLAAGDVYFTGCLRLRADLCLCS